MRGLVSKLRGSAKYFGMLRLRGGDRTPGRHIGLGDRKYWQLGGAGRHRKRQESCTSARDSANRLHRFGGYWCTRRIGLLLITRICMLLMADRPPRQKFIRSISTRMTGCFWTV